MQLPLEDVRARDLSHAPAGRFCSAMFADYGARVIKTESPRSGNVARCQAIDVSMMESRLALLGAIFGEDLAGGEIPVSMGRPAHVGVAAKAMTFLLWADSSFAVTACDDVSCGRATY